MKPRHAAALALTTCLFVSGCSFSVGLSQQQKAAVATFGNSTATISTSVPQELTSMRNRTIQMRIDELSVIDSVPKEWPDYQHLDKDFEPSTLQQRGAAAQVLAAYGNLLEKLTTSSDSSDLNQAVANFQGSVSALTQKSLSTQQLDAVGEAVRAVAGIYVERKRAEALKTIVVSVHDQTNALCNLLVADFDPNGGNLMSAVNLAAGRLKKDADGRLKEARGSLPQEHGALVKLYWEGSQNKDYAEKVGKSMVAAIEQIQKANDELLKALRAPEFAFESPAELEADVKEIQAWIAILKN